MEIGGIVLLFVGLAMAIVYMGLKRVPQSSEWAALGPGRYSKTLKTGLNITEPLMGGIGHKLNVMESALDVAPQEVISSDNAIRNRAISNIRNMLGSMELDAMLSQRDAINERPLKTVNEATAHSGIETTRTGIKEISPPAGMVESRQVTGGVGGIGEIVKTSFAGDRSAEKRS